MDVQVVHPVRSDRQIVSLCQMRNLHPASNAAAIGYIRLGESDTARGDEVLELVHRAQILAGSDWHRTIARDTAMAGIIVWYRRLLEPEDVVLSEGSRGADRHFWAPPHISVNHQRKVIAQHLAHFADPCDVLAKPIAPHLHLNGAKAFVEIILGLVQQLLDGEIEIDAAGIGAHLRVMPTEQAPKGNPGLLCFQIPQGDIHGGDSEDHHAAAAAIMHRPPHILPMLLDAVGLLALQQGLVGFANDRLDSRRAGACRIGIADPLQAIDVTDTHRDQIECGHLTVRRIGQRNRQRDAIMAGAKIGNGHR